MDFLCMDPEFGSYRDFRSPAVPKQRRKEKRAKYYHYRAVHPSWIGQKYYTLRVVSSTIHTVRVKPNTLRYETPIFHVTHVIEKEEPLLFEQLNHSSSPWVYYRPLWLPSQTHEAVAQARAADVNSYPIVVPDPRTTPCNIAKQIDHEDSNDPRSLERVPIDPPAPFPDNMPDNLHLKLQVKTWTKQDNFADKEYFTGGPDRRHHRGKRRVREKRHQKWHEKELGRGQKQCSRFRKNEIAGYEQYEYKIWDENFESADYLLEALGSASMDDATIWWDCGWPGSNWRDIDGDAWSEDEHWIDIYTERFDHLELLYKVVDWRRMNCDYEGMAEYEDDTVSVGSGVIVLQRIVDVDDDVDAMSDLAEVIAQEEWDMLSETSSVSEDFVSI